MVEPGPGSRDQSTRAKPLSARASPANTGQSAHLIGSDCLRATQTIGGPRPAAGYVLTDLVRNQLKDTATARGITEAEVVDKVGTAARGEGGGCPGSRFGAAVARRVLRSAARQQPGCSQIALPKPKPLNPGGWLPRRRCSWRTSPPSSLSSRRTWRRWCCTSAAPTPAPSQALAFLSTVAGRRGSQEAC
jgi:hypothetical protein